MKSNLPSGIPNQNRRSFLKTNAILGLGTLTAGLTISRACTSPGRQDNSDFSTADGLRARYQECLGGPFPEATPLNPKIRETIQKDGYRIESVTYEAEPYRACTLRSNVAPGEGLFFKASEICLEKLSNYQLLSDIFI